MTAEELSILLEPFSKIANKNALSSLYKVLEFSPKMVRGCSTYAAMEVDADLGFESTFYVDATTFLAVLSSMPAEDELSLEHGDGILEWVCGSAAGKLALASIEGELPKLNRKKGSNLWDVDPIFSSALTLGALSCGTNKLETVGLYGIVLDNRDDLTVCSSDNITLSACKVGEFSLDNMPPVLTLPPDGASLLAMVTKRTDGQLEFSENEVFFRGEGIRLLVKCVPPLKVDIMKIANNFTAAKQTALIPPKRVSNFVKRVSSLTESSVAAHVTLEVSKGKLQLSFEEGTKATDEHYLVDGLDKKLNLKPIELNASKLARALPHVHKAVFDYVEQKQAVLFTGEDPQFTYLIAGRSVKKEG